MRNEAAGLQQRAKGNRVTEHRNHQRQDSIIKEVQIRKLKEVAELQLLGEVRKLFYSPQ